MSAPPTFLSSVRIIIKHGLTIFLGLQLLFYPAYAQQSNSFIGVEQIHTLDFPVSCTGDEKNKISYQVFLQRDNLDGDLKFYTKGWHASNQKIAIADLLDNEVKLESMTLSGRKGNAYKNRGLWVQHLASGEKQQINYLPGALHCNSKGIINIKYNNIWVTVSAVDSLPMPN